MQSELSAMLTDGLPLQFHNSLMPMRLPETAGGFFCMKIGNPFATAEAVATHFAQKGRLCSLL